MTKPIPFIIYDASAGSGKTFTLVKSYLMVLFSNNRNDSFKTILAITFTNKAVTEMKVRIIEALTSFSDPKIIESPTPMFNIIAEELDIDKNSLHQKAILILNTILHNYAAFDISTIDGFTHKLIRTFAHDLKLPLNFEVELDQNAMISESIDNLIDKAGIDKKLTKVLVDFAIEKADDDKSWDLTRDFNTIAKVLVSENDVPFIEQIKDKTLDDFEVLKKGLRIQITNHINEIISKSEVALNLITESGLEIEDFSRKSLPNHFINLKSEKFEIPFDSKWQLALLEGETLYPKRVSADIATTIESIQPQLIRAFTETKIAVFQYKFLNSFYKNITPLSVLNAINKELLALKKEQNKMLISEFNIIISNEIKDQPTPFIYERLGEKFSSYFIDEFQDTSILQWENLIPLIDNSISAKEKGNVMLVGDAKQAIYRWRGGKAEQFINLSNGESPFYIKPELKKLQENYRSFEEIVNFNSSFFSYLANSAFCNSAYSNLYANAKQNTVKQEKGYVNLTLLDNPKDEEYTTQVLKTINNCIENGYNFRDICVLVRSKKYGIAISKLLSENGIKIISAETQLIKNSNEVKLINTLLNYLIQPSNELLKLSILYYIANKNGIEDKHTYFESLKNKSIDDVFKSFETFNIKCNSRQLSQLPLYDLVETIIRTFHLTETSNAYLQYYLDFVFEYSQKKTTDISSYLEYYEAKKDNLSIISPEGQDAIQIMTIHKSKGLEFPVVIFPYVKEYIYDHKQSKKWFAIDPKLYNGFSTTLINYNSDFEMYGDHGKEIQARTQSQLELDNINLLYVALTRPVEQLHIISEKKENPKYFSGLFINYLKEQNLYDPTQEDYSFGSPLKTSTSETVTNNTKEQALFISTSKKDHNVNIVTTSGFLWDTLQEDAIEKGNLIHEVLSKIITNNDIDFVINDFISSALINKEQAISIKEIITSIVSHPKIKQYFNGNDTIYNERPILSKSGETFIPDRLIINKENEVVIIDYKTGLKNPKHKQQLYDYQEVIGDMQFSITHKILVYINPTIDVEYV